MSRPGTIGILGPTRPAQRKAAPSSGVVRRPGYGLVPTSSSSDPLRVALVSDDSLTINSNVFRVCSASISPEPEPERHPVVLSLPRRSATVTSSRDSRKRPFACVNGDLQRSREGHITSIPAALSASASRKDRIPRPPNAFMLFANEYRKKLSCENPRESNKDISVRLGTMWKLMPKDQKDQYFEMARMVDAEHKRKYPDYVYNPKEARIRKAMRDQVRFRSQSANTRSGSVNGGVGVGVRPGLTPPQHQGGPGPVPNQLGIKNAALGLQQPAKDNCKRSLSPRRIADHQRCIREQVESGLVDSYEDAFVEMGYQHQHQQPAPVVPSASASASASASCSQPDLQPWYSMPVPVHLEGPWSAPFSGDAAECLTPPPNGSPFSGRMGLLPEVCKPAKSESSPGIGANGDQDQIAAHVMNHDGLFDFNGDVGKDASSRSGLLGALAQAAESPTQGQEVVPGSVSVPVPAPASTPVPAESKSPVGGTTRLPGFQQAFGSTEIGRFSHEGFFNTQALELQVQSPSPALAQSDAFLTSPDWPTLLYLPPGNEVHPLPPGYPERTLYPPGSCSPSYPYGLFDYNLLNTVELMPLTRPVAVSEDDQPPLSPGDCSFVDLTELQPSLGPMHFLRPSSQSDYLLQVQSSETDEFLDVNDSCIAGDREHQAVLRQMVSNEPVIIQQNERICVVKEVNPTQTFTAL